MSPQTTQSRLLWPLPELPVREIGGDGGDPASDKCEAAETSKSKQESKKSYGEIRLVY